MCVPLSVNVFIYTYFSVCLYSSVHLCLSMNVYVYVSVCIFWHVCLIPYGYASRAVGQLRGTEEMSPSKLGQHSSADYDHFLTYCNTACCF